MAITSRANKDRAIQFRSSIFRYSVLYILITVAVLFFLNLYCARLSQTVFYNNKKNTMVDLSHVAAEKIAGLEVLNKDTIYAAIADLTDPATTRMIVTTDNCQGIWDTGNELESKLVLYPEIVKALEGFDVFRWTYRDRTIRSYIATPIYSYGELIGCVYMSQYDSEQGYMIFSLQATILAITVLLVVIVLICTLILSGGYAKRLRKVMRSIRTVRNGDYTHTLALSGNDELNALSSEFNDLIARLQVSESKRNRFVSDASHELKTPLASIKLLADSILQNDMDIETIREFVSDIGNEAERLNRMSQKLLTLSRIDSQTTASMEISRIAPTVNQVLRMLSAAIGQKALQVHWSEENDCPVRIPADDLYQVIFNLVENAIKYNSQGGTLGIFLSKENELVCIRITDTGVGIPKDSIDHIFERFYRVDKARVRSTGGSGLGLSIVRNLVKRHGGKIQVESEPGKGTAFTLRFPIARENEEAVK